MKRRAETVTSNMQEFEKVEIKEEFEESFESEEGGSSRNLFQEQDFVDPNSFLEGKYEEDDDEEMEKDETYAPSENVEFSDDIQRKNMKTFNFLKYLIAQKQKSVRALQEKVKDQHGILTKLKAAK